MMRCCCIVCVASEREKARMQQYQVVSSSDHAQVIRTTALFVEPGDVLAQYGVVDSVTVEFDTVTVTKRRRFSPLQMSHDETVTLLRRIENASSEENVRPSVEGTERSQEGLECQLGLEL